MDMEHLIEFAAVARCGSFSKAAEELCLSQSAVSKHIMTLEHELDIALFDRSSRTIALTPAGERILPLAEKVTQLNNEILQTAAVLRLEGRSIIRIVSIPVMAQYNITDTSAQFGRRNTDISVCIEECEYREIAGVLLSGKYDLAFTRPANEKNDPLEYKIFYRDSLIAVMSCGSRLADRDKINVSDLKDEKLLLLDSRTSVYDICMNICHDAGFEPQIAFTGVRPENLIGMAAQGVGVALLFSRHTAYYRSGSVFVAELEPKVDSSVCLARVKGRRLSRAAQRFWDELEEYSPSEEITNQNK